MTKQSAEVIVEGLRKILISYLNISISIQHLFNNSICIAALFYLAVDNNNQIYVGYSSEQERLDEEVQGKVENLIAELQGRKHLPPRDPDARRLDDGFHYFKTNIFHKYPECFSELAEAQHPKFLVFACLDSRVSPSIVLNFKQGQAFVGRNIADMVPQFDQLRHTEIGSVIEYAVKALKVENVMIMGHSHCGGIKRLMNLPDEHCSDTHTHHHAYDFIDDWVKIGLPAKKKVLEEANDLPFEEQLKLCEKESVKDSMENLRTYPFVRSAVVNGTLTLRGGYYDLVNGSFEQWKMSTTNNKAHAYV